MLLHGMFSRYDAPSDAVAPAKRANLDGKSCTRGTPAGPLLRHMVLQILITHLRGWQRWSPLGGTLSTLCWRETSQARRIGPGSWRLHTADLHLPRWQCALPLVIIPQAAHASQGIQPGSNASIAFSATMSAAQRLWQSLVRVRAFVTNSSHDHGVTSAERPDVGRKLRHTAQLQSDLRPPQRLAGVSGAAGVSHAAGIGHTAHCQPAECVAFLSGLQGGPALGWLLPGGCFDFQRWLFLM